MRPDQGAHGFQNAVPIFPVKDVDASLRYFVETLGFKRDWYYRDAPDGPTIYASVSHDGAAIHLSRHHHHADGDHADHNDAENTHADHHQHSMSAYFYVEGVDVLHAEWKKNKANLVYAPHVVQEEPQNEPWGMREVVVHDLDGNIMRVGQLLR